MEKFTKEITMKTLDEKAIKVIISLLSIIVNIFVLILRRKK